MSKEAMVVWIMVISFGVPFVVAPLIKAISQRIARAQSGPDSGRDARLGAIERNVDLIAIEVEKLAEGQRFLTKLLAERESSAKSLPNNEQR
jgi:hypothetical protein